MPPESSDAIPRALPDLVIAPCSKAILLSSVPWFLASICPPNTAPSALRHYLSTQLALKSHDVELRSIVMTVYVAIRNLRSVYESGIGRLSFSVYQLNYLLSVHWLECGTTGLICIVLELAEHCSVVKRRGLKRHLAQEIDGSPNSTRRLRRAK